MARNRFYIVVLLVLWGCLYHSATAQVAVDVLNDDGSRYVRSVPIVLYDNYFHTAQFAIAALADAQGVVDFSLEVTYDEGLLHITQGDTLTLVLRGGSRVTLITSRTPSRGDVVKRHYRDHNDYYITCCYNLTYRDIIQLLQTRTTKLSAQAGSYWFDRRLDRFQNHFRRLFASIYNYLDINSLQS